MGRKRCSFEAIRDELTTAHLAVSLCRANLDDAMLAPDEREWLVRKVCRYTIELNRFLDDLAANEAFTP